MAGRLRRSALIWTVVGGASFLALPWFALALVILLALGGIGLGIWYLLKSLF